MSDLVPPFWFVSLHSIYWLTGVMLLERTAGGWRSAAFAMPHWFASYFLGLSLNCIAAFVLNQFIGIRLETFVLSLSAATLAFTALGFRRWSVRFVTAPRAIEPARTESWSPAQLLLLLASSLIFVEYHSPLLWGDFRDYDTFLYHLPLGKVIAHGYFPSDIGPSMNLQTEQAYPPLFYYVYGLSMRALPESAVFAIPKLTTFAFDVIICLTTYALARDRFRLRRAGALVAVLAVIMTLNPEVNSQCVTAVYFLLALYYAWPVRQNDAEIPAPRSLAIAAILSAGCYWANYVGLPLIASLAIALVVDWACKYRTHELRSSDARQWGLFILICALLMAPHPIRNLLVAGNPLYPAMLNSLGGKDVTAWFLENQSINLPRSLSMTLRSNIFCIHEGTVATILPLFATLAVVCPCRRIPTEIRVFLFVLISAFLSVWLTFLQIGTTPVFRFVYPILPVAIVALVLYVWNVARISLVGLLPLLLCFALLSTPNVGQIVETLYLPLLWRLPSPTLDGPTLYLWYLWIVGGLGVVAVTTYKLFDSTANYASQAVTSRNRAFLATAVVLLPSLVMNGWLKWFYETPHIAMAVAPYFAVGSILILVGYLLLRLQSQLSRFAGCAVLFASGVAPITILAIRANPAALHAHQLPITPDLEWMNDNLPENSVVMTFECRLHLLQRKFIPADSPRLQPFYEADTPEEALEALKSLGITHVYYSADKYEERYAPWQSNTILKSGEANPHLEFVYVGAKSTDKRDRFDGVRKVGRFNFAANE